MKSFIRLLIGLLFLTFIFSYTNVYAASKTIEDGIYYIYNSINDKYAIDIAGGKIKNKTNIQIYNGNQSAAQQWKVSYLNNGYYKIVSMKNNNYSLDVSGAKKKKGTNIQLYKSNGSKAQQWLIKDVGNGYYSIISKCNNLALDVKSGKAKNKQNIQMWTQNNSKAQKFIFTPVTYLKDNFKISNGKYAISSLLREDYAVKVSERKAANKINIEINDFHGVIDQYWYITQLSNGYYKIATERDHNYVLDLTSGNKHKGANIQLYKYSGSINQQFIIRKNEDGSFTFVNRANGLALDVHGGSTSNGTNIQTYTINGSIAQKFNLIKEEDTYINSKELTLKNMDTTANNLMIVAHPDDETLWGSHGLYHEKYNVVCVTCGPTRRDREYEFKRVMTLFQDDYMMLGFPDLVNGKKSDWKKDWGAINSELQQIINSKDWDKIVVHNPEGEYGHIHHKMLSQILTEKANHNYLNYFGRFYWGDIPIDENTYRLSDEEYNFKMNKVIPVYESQVGAITNLKNMYHYESWFTYDQWK